LIKELVMTPSKVYHGYFRGQRKNYFSPVMFFLLSIGLLIFLGNEVANLEDQITHRNDEFGRYLHQYQKIRYLICIPLISLFTWAFFYKRFNLAECVAFWFFCLGLACIIGSISCLPQALFIHHRDTVRYYADWLSWIMVMIHIFIVFFDRKVWSAIKCFLLGCSYYLILVYIYTFIAWDAGIPVTFNIYDIIRSIF
jgi:Protein of unknown function (DUF3667)